MLLLRFLELLAVAPRISVALELNRKQGAM